MDIHFRLKPLRAALACLCVAAPALAILASLLPLLHRATPDAYPDAGRRRTALTAANALNAPERTLTVLAYGREASFPDAHIPVAGPDPTGPDVETYRHAWTDRHPPAGDASPEWVLLPALFAPSYTHRPVPGRVVFAVNPDAEDRIAGYSGFEASAGEALASAWDGATARMQSNVEPRCAFLFGREFAQVPAQVLREAIRDEIHRRRDALLPAVYQDAIDAAGLGTVHRAAVCVVCPPEIMDAIASSAFRQAVASVEAARQFARTVFLRRTAELGGGLLLLLATFALYAFLNAVTKGYYTWTLRIAAAVLYLASLGALLLAMHYITHTPGDALPGL